MNPTLPLTQSVTATALAASGTVNHYAYFKRAARIKNYWAVPSVAEASHATQALTVTFTNKGGAGAGSTVLATLTNDTDLADTTTREQGAWAAHVVKQLDAENRPGGTALTNNADSVAAGDVVQITIAKAAGTATGDVTAGMDYVEST